MLGATKVPNGVFSSSPPASSSCASPSASAVRGRTSSRRHGRCARRASHRRSRARRARPRSGVAASSETRTPPRRRHHQGERRDGELSEKNPIRPRESLSDAIGLVAASAISAQIGRTAAPSAATSCAGAATAASRYGLVLSSGGLEARPCLPRSSARPWCRPCRCRPGKRVDIELLPHWLQRLQRGQHRCRVESRFALRHLGEPADQPPRSFMIALRSAIGSA